MRGAHLSEKQGSHPTRGMNERAALILLLFVAAAFAFKFASDRVLPNNPSRDPVHRPYNPKIDPPVGKQVPNVPVWTADGKRKPLISVPRGKQWLLIVFYPPCTSCNSNPLRELDAAMRELPDVEWRVTVPFDAQGSQAYARSIGINMTFYEERAEEASEVFNAVWRPRLYLVDASGKLRLRQELSETLTQAIQRVRKMTGV